MSKTHFKWRFKGSDTIHYAIDQDNEKTFIKSTMDRYKFTPDEIEITHQGKTGELGYIDWKRRE